MSAATSSRDGQRKAGDIAFYKLGAVKVYKETLLSLRSDGYAYPARSGTVGDIFIGVAVETVDNSAGSAGDKGVRVYKSGTFVFAKATAVIADLIAPMYASDDSTLTATTTNNQLVGYPVDLIDSATLRIRIDSAVK